MHPSWLGSSFFWCTCHMNTLHYFTFHPPWMWSVVIKNTRKTFTYLLSLCVSLCICLLVLMPSDTVWYEHTQRIWAWADSNLGVRKRKLSSSSISWRRARLSQTSIKCTARVLFLITPLSPVSFTIRTLAQEKEAGCREPKGRGCRRWRSTWRWRRSRRRGLRRRKAIGGQNKRRRERIQVTQSKSSRLMQSNGRGWKYSWP